MRAVASGLLPRRPLLAVLAVLVAIAVGLPASGLRAQTAGPAFQRLAGPTRVETAVQLSRFAYPDGARVALLARQDTYPDALAGGPLAAALDGPILLTHPRRLPPPVEAELRRLAVDRVLVLGSAAAVGDAVADAVRGLGVDVERVAGANRFQTARAIAERVLALTGADTAYVARGIHPSPTRGWADAVAAGPVAAAKGRPVVLAHGRSVPAASAEVLDRVRSSVVLGSTAALGHEVEERARAATASVRRIGGTDRWRTSLLLAEHALEEGASASEVWLVTGRNFADALTAGPVAAKRGAVLLLTDGQGWGASQARDWLRERGHGVARVVLVGGPGVLPDAMQTDIRDGLPGDTQVQLVYSTSPDHRAPRPLDGATLRGRVFVFLGVCSDNGASCVPVD